MSTRAIAVIGAGVVGASCASRLRLDGHDVTLFEGRGIGSGASWGNAGIVSSGGCVPLGMPGLWRRLPRMLTSPAAPLVIRWRYLPRILPWLVRLLRASSSAEVERISRALAQLIPDAQSAYRALLGEPDYDRLFVPRGLLFPYCSRTAFDAGANARELRRRRGVRFAVLEGSELREMEPGLSSDHKMGVYFPDASHTVDPAGLTMSLVDGFVAKGGAVRAETVKGIRFPASGRVELVTDSGSAPFEKVVIAAGAWSGSLARACGTRVPLDTERGYHVMLGAPGVRLNRPVISGYHSIALTPMAGGLRISGIVEFAGLNAPPDPARAGSMLDCARRMLPGLQMDDAKTWLGFRPSVPDSLPVIGRCRTQPDAICAFGHGHYGVTFAAITANLVADIAAERPSAIDISAFSPGRFH